MAIIDMAQFSDGRPVSLASISRRQNISLSYLEQLFARLRKAGIVNSVKGPNGGYVLSKNPSQITIADIICGIGESIKMTNCGNKAISCTKNKKKCHTHDLWRGLENSIGNYLASFSLADFLSQSAIGSSFGIVKGGCGEDIGKNIP